MEIADIPDNFP